MHDFSSEIKSGLSAILKLQRIHNDRKAVLVNEDSVYLQVALIKTPKIQNFARKVLQLHHSPFGDDPEVCLFVHDEKANDTVARTADEQIEYSISHYEDLLKKHKTSGISAVLPFQQLKTEYDSYELQRKLASQFQLFLCDHSLVHCGNFLRKLGKAFSKENKYPLGIKLPKDNVNFDSKLQQQINQAILSTWFYIRSHSDTISISVGKVTMTEEALQENLLYVVDEIVKGNVIPGGFKNIKSMFVKTSRSKAVPVYINLDLASASQLSRPKIKPLRKKLNPVTDELSTLPGKQVTVLPSGDVIVSKLKREKYKPKDKMEDYEDDNEDDNEDEDEDEDESFKAEDTLDDDEDDRDAYKKKEVVSKEEKESDSEDEDEAADAAEQNYLSGWEREWLKATDAAKNELKEELKRKRNEESSKNLHKKSKGKGPPNKNTNRKSEVKKENNAAATESSGVIRKKRKFEEKFAERANKKPKTDEVVKSEGKKTKQRGGKQAQTQVTNGKNVKKESNSKLTKRQVANKQTANKKPGVEKIASLNTPLENEEQTPTKKSGKNPGTKKQINKLVKKTPKKKDLSEKKSSNKSGVPTKILKKKKTMAESPGKTLLVPKIGKKKGSIKAKRSR